MPQLWTETMVSQYFWLITIFFSLYLINATRIIPQIAYTLKSRRLLGGVGPVGTTTAIISEGSPKSFLSSVLSSPRGTDIKATICYAPTFNSASKAWAKKSAPNRSIKK